MHGVPFTLKDAIEAQGVICTGGTEGRAHYVPDQDAVVVKRLREAGAILLGKTNCPELGWAWEADNLIYGRTNNPYDLNSVPGRKQRRRVRHYRGGRFAIRVGE